MNQVNKTDKLFCWFIKGCRFSNYQVVRLQVRMAFLIILGDYIIE